MRSLVKKCKINTLDCYYKCLVWNPLDIEEKSIKEEYYDLFKDLTEKGHLFGFSIKEGKGYFYVDARVFLKEDYEKWKCGEVQ